MAFFKDYGQRQLWRKLCSELENLYPLSQVFITEHIFGAELDVDMKSSRLGERKRKEPLYLCCHDIAIGVEGIKYITLKKYFSFTAFVLFMASLVSWRFCLWSLQQTGSPISGAASLFYSCWDSCGHLVSSSVTHLFPRKKRRETQQHTWKSMGAVGCPLVLLQRGVGTTILPSCLCFFHILKYRRFLWAWGKTFFLLWGCSALSLQLSSGRAVTSECFSSKHFWQRLT